MLIASVTSWASINHSLPVRGDQAHALRSLVAVEANVLESVIVPTDPAVEATGPASAIALIDLAVAATDRIGRTAQAEATVPTSAIAPVDLEVEAIDLIGPTARAEATGLIDLGEATVPTALIGLVAATDRIARTAPTDLADRTAPAADGGTMAAFTIAPAGRTVPAREEFTIAGLGPDVPAMAWGTGSTGILAATIVGTDGGNQVRRRNNNYFIYNNYFNRGWWGGHYHNLGGWHYGYCFNRYPYSYWWTVPTYAALTNWFTWSTPAVYWEQPIYYDYGPGGNVYYENNMVYVDGQEVGTPQDFAASAAQLATVEPPASEQEAEDADWMPLGTFVVSSSQKESDPTRYLQLAVDKQGIVSGTLYDAATDVTQTVLGQVDRETQRVAFRIGDSDEVVAETGLYNLTQDEAPMMVHFGPDRVENWLLVRLENPEQE